MLSVITYSFDRGVPGAACGQIEGSKVELDHLPETDDGTVTSVANEIKIVNMFDNLLI